MSPLSLPSDVEDALRQYFTCEFTTLNRRGEPLTWPTVPLYVTEAGEIVVTASIAFPIKASNARRNPHVSLLYSDPTGSGLEDPPAVLVQGNARVAEELDLTDRALRHFKLSVSRQPESRQFVANPIAQRLFTFYFQRISITVQPTRILTWPHRDFSQPPTELLNVG
jgi:hypothetical protein